MATLVCPGASTARLIDLGLTVFDTQTGLQWEKKVEGSGCLHCVNDTYNWCQATGIDAPNCDVAPPSWIAQVNQEGFAGYTDWRAPTLDELLTIVDCSSGAPCIDPIFGPTASRFYWSATEIDPPQRLRREFRRWRRDHLRPQGPHLPRAGGAGRPLIGHLIL
ncbi:MAG: DUF1566 domain-containing protein [candidate division NC10 bacterium]|nr:DUF1566 domain-containing protein [candidate division NC10 bacterium]